MALYKMITFPDGFVAAYHRVGYCKIEAAGGRSGFTLESFASYEARAVPGATKRDTEYEFMFIGGDFLTECYRALMAMPEWDGYESDVEAAPASVPAVLASGKVWVDGKGWVAEADAVTLEDAQAAALTAIDAMAGAARLRYITSVAGQAETYQAKAEQAAAWTTAGYAGNPPSFIAAEAQALGVDPQNLAAEILTSAHLWREVKGPQIEAARRKWKVAAGLAANPGAIAECVAQARSDFGSM